MRSARQQQHTATMRHFWIHLITCFSTYWSHWLLRRASQTHHLKGFDSAICSAMMDAYQVYGAGQLLWSDEYVECRKEFELGPCYLMFFGKSPCVDSYSHRLSRTHFIQTLVVTPCHSYSRARSELQQVSLLLLAHSKCAATTCPRQALCYISSDGSSLIFARHFTVGSWGGFRTSMQLFFD